MDLIILLVICGLIFFWKREFKFFIYFIGIIEIFFRIIHFISTKINVHEFSFFVTKYIPSSIIGIFTKYSTGLLLEILSWIVVICFGFLEMYLIKYFIKKK